MNTLVRNRFWRTGAPIAIFALIINNLIPLLGVLFLGWELYQVVLIYWLENGVIGLFNELKMAFARGTAPADAKEAAFNTWIGEQNMQIVRFLGLLFYMGFFLVHYGIFWAVHGVFVYTLFGPTVGFLGSMPGFSSGVPTPGQGSLQGMWGVIGAIILSHGASFVQNYIGQGEYLTATPAKLMMQPYGRVVVLHLTIIGGGLLVASLGQPLYALLLLIVLKTGVDLATHLRERRHVQV